MSLHTHRILTCDRCHVTETVKYADGDTIPIFMPPRGWVEIVFANHNRLHFCSKCAPLISMAVNEQTKILVTFPFPPRLTLPETAIHPPLTP